MNTKASPHIAPNYSIPAGSAPESKKEGLTMIVGALVVMMCFAAPLLLTLPQTMDAAARPIPMIGEAVAADAPTGTFHERHPVKAGADWADSMEERVD
ncbi:MAG TPA: hypothetical protein VD867_17700 [Burkholderiales bacterium]|nr:hypothetical protein [Burkholderiales bacterium]